MLIHFARPVLQETHPHHYRVYFHLHFSVFTFCRRSRPSIRKHLDTFLVRPLTCNALIVRVEERKSRTGSAASVRLRCGPNGSALRLGSITAATFQYSNLNQCRQVLAIYDTHGTNPTSHRSGRIEPVCVLRMNLAKWINLSYLCAWAADLFHVFFGFFRFVLPDRY